MATMRDGVRDVLLLGDDPKILLSVIRPHEVDVVYLPIRRDVTEECLCDEPVHVEHGTVAAVPSEFNARVSIAKERLQHRRGDGLRSAIPSHDDVTEASYLSGTRDFVSPGLAGQRLPLSADRSFCGIVRVSHREPPCRVPVVRLGWDVDASRRAALHSTNEAM